MIVKRKFARMFMQKFIDRGNSKYYENLTNWSTTIKNGRNANSTNILPGASVQHFKI